MSQASPKRFPRLSPWWLGLALPVLVVLYYAIGMGLANFIDDDPGFDPPHGADESRAVAMAAGLILREVDAHKWVANDPFFVPSWALDDMPSYQMGMVAAISRFVADMVQVSGGLDDADPELERAAGFLKYPGTVWKFDPRTSWAPTASSEKQYRSAARNLLVFNQRLAAGQARFDRRPEVLALLLRGMAQAMDEESGRLVDFIDGDHASWWSGKADDTFFDTKGRLYAQMMIIGELGWDFAPMIAERGLGERWQALLAALSATQRIHPWVVLNGSAQSMLVPNHLSNLGLRLLAARLRLGQVIEALDR